MQYLLSQQELDGIKSELRRQIKYEDKAIRTEAGLLVFRAMRTITRSTQPPAGWAKDELAKAFEEFFRKLELDHDKLKEALLE